MAVTAHGDPKALAMWAHSALQRRTWGVHFALVIADDTAALVDANSKKCARIEREHPESIAGYYLGCMNRTRPYVTATDILEAIEATLGEAA